MAILSTDRPRRNQFCDSLDASWIACTKLNLEGHIDARRDRDIILSVLYRHVDTRGGIEVAVAIVHR